MAFTPNDLTWDVPLRFVRGYNYDSVSGSVHRDDRKSGAVRTRIDEDNFSNLSSRISAFITALGGNEHPDDSNLILHNISATLVEGLPAQFDAEYRAKRIGGYHISQGHVEVLSYKFPDGTTIPDDYRPNYRMVRVPTFTLEFIHYYSQVGAPGQNTSNINTTNDGPYDLEFFLPDGTSGLVLSASTNTLRYNAPGYAQQAAGGTSWWKKAFSLTWRPDGWLQQFRKPDGTIVEKDAYVRSTFPIIP